MKIRIASDYTTDQGEILVCTHETTGGNLSILVGDLSLQITGQQAQELVNNLTKGLSLIQEYDKMLKKHSPKDESKNGKITLNI